MAALVEEVWVDDVQNAFCQSNGPHSLFGTRDQFRGR